MWGRGGGRVPGLRALVSSVVQVTEFEQQQSTMGVLPKSLFAGADTISDNDKAKIFVNNFSDSIETVLGDFDWDGKAAGTIGLTLGNDNRKVESGRFITRGALVEKSISVKACEIWAEASETAVLTIKLPRAEIFKFVDGGLYSAYVNQETVTHYFHNVEEGRAPVPILLPHSNVTIMSMKNLTVEPTSY